MWRNTCKVLSSTWPAILCKSVARFTWFAFKMYHDMEPFMPLNQ